MRLIETNTLQLIDFSVDEVPRHYAILSHTWEKGEATFQDWENSETAEKKAGFSKIINACQQARKDGLDYLWVDTNCIDKKSSAELSEAINSMFSWYQNASICYAFLSDVEPMSTEWENMPPHYVKQFLQSRWFTRGWTLQELLAPTELVFYSRDWTRLASRYELASVVATATQIDVRVLNNHKSLSECSIAERMSWLAHRQTTRIEDLAYCMLGIFDIHMPLLYGEGKRAFMRLQEEIIKFTNDHTIFCWTWVTSVPNDWVSLLAPCPEAFKDASRYTRIENSLSPVRSFAMTNAGLSITLPVVQTWSYYVVILDAEDAASDSGRRKGFHVGIPVSGFLDTPDKDNLLVERIAFPPRPIQIFAHWSLCFPALHVRSTPAPRRVTKALSSEASQISRFRYAFLLVIDDPTTLLSGVGFKWLKGPNSIAMESTLPPLKLVPEKSSGGTSRKVCLTERCRRVIHIETFPPGLFDPTNSLIVFNGQDLCSGALMLLTQAEREVTSAIFLGVKFGNRTTAPQRFCRRVNATGLFRMKMGHRGPSNTGFQTILEKEMQWMSESNHSQGLQFPGLIALKEVDCRPGLVSVLYLTTDSNRTMGLEALDEDIVVKTDISTNVAAARQNR